MRLGCWALLALSACYSPSARPDAPCTPSADDCPAGESCQASGGEFVCKAKPEIDGGIDGGSTCLASGGLLDGLCLVTTPTTALQLSASKTINTGSTGTGNCTEIPARGGSSLCIVAATSIEIASGATIRATGTNPLVLVALRTLTIAGVVDVSSHGLNLVIGAPLPIVGAGARTAAECGAIGIDGTTPANTPVGAGGGAGASFGGVGGAGGLGDQGAPGGVPMPAAVLPTTLVGGCAGGRGGNGFDNNQGSGPGGAGGGAIYLYAGDSITIDGRVAASGAGGAGSTAGSLSGGGGGGGGTGGMIALQAPRIGGTGAIYANGGGGGGGNGNSPDDTGGLGGETTTPTTAAVGGTARNGGGAGGVGSIGAQAGQIGKNGNDRIECGGGGGGGGGGVIRLFGVAATTFTAVSPPARP